MRFQNRLLVASAATLVTAVIVVAMLASFVTRRAFDEMGDRQREAMIGEFRRQFRRQGEEVQKRLRTIARSEVLVRVEAAARRPGGDLGAFVQIAEAQAGTQGLDFLEIVGEDGRIISSAQWPARFGYSENWVTAPIDWPKEPPFLRLEELADERALGLMAVEPIGTAPGRVFLIGGLRLDEQFLTALPVAADIETLLYRPDAKAATQTLPPRLRDLAETVQQARTSRSVKLDIEGQRWTFQGTPLKGRDDKLLGVLLVGSSTPAVAQLNRFIEWVSLGAALAGLGFGLILSWWVTSYISRPVQELAAGARQVAAGHWDQQVAVTAGGEIGDLARAFNQMTGQLAAQRDRLLQSERVAAWRELARRLAHELKNPLFPMQITLENLQRARGQSPEEFDEVFSESTATLSHELASLKTIIGRFGDFSRMPAPQPEKIDLRDPIERVVHLHEGRWATEDSLWKCDVRVPEEALWAHADPELVKRALDNLVLNALDAMPQGGVLTLRAGGAAGAVWVEVGDTGQGLTPEERERLFTPYYTTKQYGTGLGLAIVQSIVSDHGGRISVRSDPGEGTLFRIELPAFRDDNDGQPSAGR